MARQKTKLRREEKRRKFVLAGARHQVTSNGFSSYRTTRDPPHDSFIHSRRKSDLDLVDVDVAVASG